MIRIIMARPAKGSMKRHFMVLKSCQHIIIVRKAFDCIHMLRYLGEREV